MKKIVKSLAIIGVAATVAIGIGMLIGYCSSYRGDSTLRDVASNSLANAVPAETPYEVAQSTPPVQADAAPVSPASSTESADDGIIRFSINTGFSDHLGTNARPGKMIMAKNQ